MLWVFDNTLTNLIANISSTDVIMEIKPYYAHCKQLTLIDSKNGIFVLKTWFLWGEDVFAICKQIDFNYEGIMSIYEFFVDSRPQTHTNITKQPL